MCVPSSAASAECRPGVCRRPCGGTGATTLGGRFAGDLDCPADMDCRSERAVAAPTCAPASSPSCSGPSDCGDALECRESSDGLHCRWPAGPIGAGEPCVGDRDCSEGLRCVEHAFGRTCEVPCRTSSMRCQDGWACGGLPAGRGVCELIGE